jgi:hypothetical protein
MPRTHYPADGRPEPDIAIVRGKASISATICPQDVALVGEVADSSPCSAIAKEAVYTRPLGFSVWIINLLITRLKSYRSLGTK